MSEEINGPVAYLEPDAKYPMCCYKDEIDDEVKGAWIPLYTAAPTIPAGWQLVPVDPTDEMFVAGDAFMECTSSLGEAWEAMLAAAPKPGDTK